MNQDVKKLWIDALRSGKYQQSKGALKTKNGYCCLGVLCDLYHKETNKGYWSAYGYFQNDDSACCAWLPRDVFIWAGLSNSNPEVSFNNKSRSTLANLNDSRFSFQFIADIIEKEL